MAKELSDEERETMAAVDARFKRQAELLLRGWGYGPGGQAPGQGAPAAPAVDYSKLQGIAHAAVAEAIKSNPDVVQVNLKAQLIQQELARIPTAIEEFRGQLEQIAQAKATSAVEGYATKEEINAWKNAYDGMTKTLEEMKAASERMEATYKEMDTSNQAKEEELKALKTAVQEARNTFKELKPVYGQMTASNKAKDASYQKMEATYQALKSSVDALEGLEEKIKDLEDQKGGISSLFNEEGELTTEAKVALEPYIEGIAKAVAGQTEGAFKMFFEKVLEKYYHITPAAFRKLIRVASEQGIIGTIPAEAGQSEEIEEAEEVEESAPPGASGEKPGRYLDRPGVVSKKRAKKKGKKSDS